MSQNNKINKSDIDNNNLITSPRQNVSQTELKDPFDKNQQQLISEYQQKNQEKIIGKEDSTQLIEIKQESEVQNQYRSRQNLGQQQRHSFNQRKVQPLDFQKRQAFKQNSQISQIIVKKDEKQKNRILKSFKIHINNLNSKLFESLKDKHYLMINDLATIDMVEEKIRQDKEKQRTISQHCEHLIGSFYQQIFFVIDKIWPKVQNPNNPIIKFSTWCEMLTIAIILYLFTFYLFYNYDGLEEYFQIKFWAQIVFLICPFIRINCGYYRSGKFIDDRHHILIRYIKAFLFYDLCGNLSILYLQVYQPVTWVEKIPVIAVFFKFKTLKSLFRDMQEKLCLTGNKVYMWQMMKLFFITIILCHVIGTFYHLAAIFQYEVMDEKNTWQHNMGIYEESWEIRYIQSFYWAQSTIMLIGSKGDTTFETVFSCATIICTVSYFATILSSVEMIMADLNRKTEQYRKETEILNIFFDQNEQIKKGTQSLLQNYLKYYYVGHKDMTANENVKEILEKFPQPLQDIVKYDRYSFFIKQLDFLRFCFSYHTIEAIPDIVEEEYYMPNQFIFQEEDGINPKLYLVMKGTVSLHNNQGIIVGQRVQNQYFGEKQFFSNTKHTLSAKSDDFTTILVIDRTKFLQLLEHTERDLESFHQIQHSFRVTNYSEKIQETCYKCDKNHIESNCNLVHYSPNKLNLLLKYIFYSPQYEREKNKNVRKITKDKRFNSWVCRNECENDTIIVQQNTTLKHYVKPYQQVLQICQEQDYGSNADDYDDDEDEYDEEIDDDSFSSENSSFSQHTQNSSQEYQLQQQNLSQQNKLKNINLNNFSVLKNKGNINKKQFDVINNQNTSFGQINQQVQNHNKVEQVICEPGSEPEPGSIQDSSLEINDQFIMTNFDNLSQNYIKLEGQEKQTDVSQQQEQDPDLMYVQFPSSRDNKKENFKKQSSFRNLSKAKQGSKTQIRLQTQEQPLSQRNMNPFLIDDNRERRKSSMAKSRKSQRKKTNKALNIMKNQVFNTKGSVKDNKALKAITAFKSAVKQKNSGALGLSRKEIQIINSMPQQFQKMQQLIINYQQFAQNQNQQDKNLQEKQGGGISIAGILQQNKNNQQDKDDFEKWQDNKNYVRLKQQKLDAVKNLAMHIQSSNYLKLQEMVSNQVYAIEKSQQEQQYRQFFCEFDQYKEFTYFLQHNNLLVVLKNYYRYIKKEHLQFQQINQKKHKRNHSRQTSNIGLDKSQNINLQNFATRDQSYQNSGAVTPLQQRQRIQSIMQIGNNWHY